MRVVGVDRELAGKIAGDFEALVDDALGRSGSAGAAALRAGGPPTAADLAAVPAAFAGELRDRLAPALGDAWTAAAARTRIALGILSPADEPAPLTSAGFVPPPPAAELAERYLAAATNRLAGIGDAVWAATRAELVEGIAAGESIDELAARVEQAAGVPAGRAQAIARTEALGAAAAGEIAQFRATGLSGTKTWVSSHDERVRPTHELADGQTVPLGDPFIVGGWPMDRPHDPTGPPEEIVNCRCGLAFDVDVPAVAGAGAETFHLPGMHNQQLHGRRIGRTLGRPGMGDISIDDWLPKFAGGSAEEHLDELPDGSFAFSAERQALHDEIIRRELDGKPAQESPLFHMMGGGPASGKSHMIKSDPALQDDDAVLINADAFKTDLPEYAAGVDAGDPTIGPYVHEESSWIANRLQAAAFERRVHVNLDGIGDHDADELRGRLKKIRAAGYSPRGHYVSVPTELALERSDARGKRTGRYVPHSILTAVHAAVSRTLPEAYSDFDELDLFDSRSGLVPIASWRGGVFTVHDDQRWAEFLAKGDTG